MPAKHTLGPWAVNKHGDEIRTDARPSEATWIAKVFVRSPLDLATRPNREAAEANARLIAAAPDGLVAAMEAADFIRANHYNETVGEWDSMDAQEVASTLDLFIAKATED
jgi:hypothetical protein